VSKRRPELAVFWGDTRTLLSYRERKEILPRARLESITPDEVLVRDYPSQRLIVITSRNEPNLFCALCKTDAIRKMYGATCTGIAHCLVEKDDKDPLGEPEPVKNGTK